MLEIRNESLWVPVGAIKIIIFTWSIWTFFRTLGIIENGGEASVIFFDQSCCMASVPWLKRSSLQEMYFLTGGTALNRINLLLVLLLCGTSFEKSLDSSPILNNPSFTETFGRLHNSVCWADTPLLLRCFCSIDTSKFPWKFLSFLNSRVLSIFRRYVRTDISGGERL